MSENRNLPTNSEAIDAVLPSDRQCLWQITPQELPKDMPAMSLELWNTPEGMKLVQLLVEDRGKEWYRKVECATVFHERAEVATLRAQRDALVEAASNLCEAIQPWGGNVMDLEPHFRAPIIAARETIAAAKDA